MISDTTKIVIVFYPHYAGGKFLINSLGLSDDAVLQDSKLAEQQLNNNFNQYQKFKFLSDKLHNITDHWNDLNLGCYQLFGVSDDAYTKTDNISFNQIIFDIVNNNKYFFLVAHTYRQFELYLKYWKNPTIIMFENSNKFMLNRLIKITPPDELIRYNPDLIDFYKNQFDYFTDRIEKRLLLSTMHQTYIQQFKKTYDKDVYIVDNDIYFNKEKTIGLIRNFYNILNLSDFNEELISEYYTLWITKLEELKKTNKYNNT